MIQALQFALARLRAHEDVLQRYSVKQSDLADALADKSIAIVGNARALADTTYGAAIDAADIVIRINRAPMPAKISHGAKTNWLALATALSHEDFSRISPDRTLWMSHKRKRLTLRIAQTTGFYLHPLADYRALETQLGNPPSTGAMLINLTHNSNAKSIDLYGFDFFASKSLSGSRSAAQVPHDFDAEKSLVHALADTDPRLTLHK